MEISLALFFVSGLIFCSCKDEEEDTASHVTFNSLNLDKGSYWNGSDNSGSFKVDIITFPNVYDSKKSSWGGFAYSNKHDVRTAGLENQYSSYALPDSNSSNTFVLFHQNGAANTLVFDKAVTNVKFKVTNSTFVALSMKYGNEISKKFGGADSTEKDWFKLDIIAIDVNNTRIDTASVYLADYRFEVKKEDYILNEWLLIDLSKFAALKKIQFNLSSSDVKDNVILTPIYFCLDDIEYRPVTTN